MTVARYQRVADSIRRQIADGILTAGDRLPTEPLLVDEYGVSRLTVRHALDVLQAEGMIEKFHGRGTFVRRRPQRISYVSAVSGGFRQPETDHDEIETYVRPGSVLAEAPLPAHLGAPRRVRPQRRVAGADLVVGERRIGDEIAEIELADLARERRAPALRVVDLPRDRREGLAVGACGSGGRTAALR